MLTLADALINGSALWKIIVAAFIGGAGVAIAYGVAILGYTRAQDSRSGLIRAGNLALTTLAGLFCVAAVIAGVYAMTHK